MTADELEEAGVSAATKLLEVNSIGVREGRGGKVALDFAPPDAPLLHRTIGRGADLVCACEDALAAADEHTAEHLPMDALHLAAVCASDPVWLLRAVAELFAGTPVEAEAAREDDDEDDDEDAPAAADVDHVSGDFDTPKGATPLPFPGTRTRTT